MAAEAAVLDSTRATAVTARLRGVTGPTVQTVGALAAAAAGGAAASNGGGVGHGASTLSGSGGGGGGGGGHSWADAGRATHVNYFPGPSGPAMQNGVVIIDYDNGYLTPSLP